MLRLLSEHWRGFAHLFFPELCLGCKISLDLNEQHLCEACKSGMPLTHYWGDPANPVAQMFWGKVDLEAASSFLFFYQGGMVQQMLHALKYQKSGDVGITLGGWMGEALRDSPFSTVDVIVPVPLHPKKEAKRGYNQSMKIATGLAACWNLEIAAHALSRVDHHESQTQKGRYARWMNVKERFTVRETHNLEGKHVLLIDDVITTGATLEACAQMLLSVDGIKVSILTLACPAPF